MGSPLIASLTLTFIFFYIGAYFYLLWSAPTAAFISLHSYTFSHFLRDISLILMALACYFLTMFTNPGFLWRGHDLVPGVARDRFRQVLKISKAARYESKENGCRRFCRRCLTYKPDRCHHCHHCNRCVLKFDHHCSFLHSCVGYGNFKFFCLFLFWGGLALASMSFTLLFAYTEPGKRKIAYLFDSHGLFVFFIVLIGLTLWLALFLFLSFQLFLVARGWTSLEFSEKRGTYKHGEKYNNIYNVGLKRNWIEVFGTEWWMWFLPIQSQSGEGIEFPVNIKDSFSSKDRIKLD